VASVRDTDTVRSVTVPEGNASKRVEVTVVDDDGESATDVIVVSSENKLVQRYSETPTNRTAQCTYHEYAARESGQPIRCWDEASGEVIYDRDPAEGPHNVYDPHSHPNYEVEWYFVAKSDDDSIEPGAALAREVPAPSNPIQKANNDRANETEPRNTSVTEFEASADAESGFEPYTRDDRTVSTDLTGDGRVDLQDWQERHGDPSAKSLENDREKISSLKYESSETQESPEDVSDTASELGKAVSDAFDGLSDALSPPAQDAAPAESDQPSGSEDEDSSIADSVSNTVESITDAFAGLAQDSDGQDGDGDDSGSDSESAAESEDSCNETSLGFTVCL
jgi:hypothetical protein